MGTHDRMSLRAKSFLVEEFPLSRMRSSRVLLASAFAEVLTAFRLERVCFRPGERESYAAY